MRVAQNIQGGGRLSMRAAALILSLLLLPMAVSGDMSLPRLQHARSSQRAVAEAVLAGLRDSDVEALRSLALSRGEFEKYIWPELPASRPGTNLSVDFVWADVSFRSVNRMMGTLERFKGQKLSLVSLRHRGGVVPYPTHKAYPDWEIIIRDPAGKDEEYPLFGTLVEMDGVWKVYSYAPYD